MDKNNEKDPWYYRTTEQGDLKINWPPIIGVLTGVSIISTGLVYAAFLIAPSNYKPLEPVSLIERLESSYQQCRTMKDKEVRQTLPLGDYSCQEVEDLYLKVNPVKLEPEDACQVCDKFRDGPPYNRILLEMGTNSNNGNPRW